MTEIHWTPGPPPTGEKERGVLCEDPWSFDSTHSLPSSGEPMVLNCVYGSLAFL